ncbi:MAG: RNA 2',3'-cyclic phosphodiesterase [Chloroflexota bacterium]
MNESDHWRFFIAAPVSESWNPWISNAQDSMERALPGYFRWTARESWHITVLFIGSQPSSAASTIQDALLQVAAHTPTIKLTAGEVISPASRERPRLVWLSCEESGSLHPAQRELLLILADLELTASPFRAHITLGRARIPFQRAIKPTNETERPPPSSIQELILFRSHLDHQGARYEVLTRAALKRRAAVSKIDQAEHAAYNIATEQYQKTGIRKSTGG